MNIFDALKGYQPKYELKEKRTFNDEEKAAVVNAQVKPSQYGFSVCFLMVDGCKKYIPVSRDTTAHDGDAVDLDTAKLLTLVKDDKTIYRVEF